MDMKFLSYEENDERQDEGPIDKALTYNYFVKEGKMSPEDIGKRLQISGQTVRNYLKLLSPKLREYWPQINSGKLPVDRALKKLKGKDYDTGNGEGDSRHRLPNTKGIKSIYESDGKPEKMTQKEWELWILPDVRRFLAFKLGLRYSEYKPPEEAPPAAKVPTLKIKRERANKLLVALGKSNARTWSDDAVEQKLSAIPNVADDSVTVEEDPSLQKLLEKLRELYGKGGKVQIEKD